MWFVNILIVVQSTIWQILNNETHVYLCFGIRSLIRGEDIHESFFTQAAGRRRICTNQQSAVSCWKTGKDVDWVCAVDQRSGLFCGGKFKCGKAFACAGNHYWSYDRGDGNVASGDGGQCVGFSYRK